MSTDVRQTREQFNELARRYSAQVLEWINQARTSFPGRLSRWLLGDSDYTQSRAYLDAEQLVRTFEVAPGSHEQFEWVSEYAKNCYDGLTKTFCTLDEKADALIKYLGGGTLLIAILGPVAGKTISAWVAVLVLPSIICMLVAIFFAVCVRLPRRVPAPPSVLTAVQYVEYFGENSAATFLPLWHQCCEGIDYVNAWKSRLVHVASKWYLVALFLLLVPVIGAAVSLFQK
jgi:hypothetical protein